MRRRVMAPYRGAAGVIDAKLQRRADLQGTLLYLAQMHEEIAGLFLRVGDAESDAVTAEHAGIADLAARFRVERRLVHDDGAGLACLETVDLLAVFHQRRHRAFGGLGLVAQEFGGTEFFAQRKPYALGCGIAASGPGRASLFA